MKKTVLLISMLLFTGTVYANDDDAAAQAAAEAAAREQAEQAEQAATERERQLDLYEQELRREEALSAGE